MECPWISRLEMVWFHGGYSISMLVRWVVFQESVTTNSCVCRISNRRFTHILIDILFKKIKKATHLAKLDPKKHLPLLYYVCVIFMSFFLSNSRSCSVYYPAERRLLMSVTRSQAEEATGGGVGGDICRSVGDHGNIMGIWWEYLGIWWKSDGNLWACCFWWGYRGEGNLAILKIFDGKLKAWWFQNILGFTMILFSFPMGIPLWGMCFFVGEVCKSS